MPPAGPGAILRGIAVTAWERPRKRVKGMTSDSRFTLRCARPAPRASGIGIDWDASPFGLEQFRKGMDIELEHGTRDPETNVTDDDVTMTAKIARAHLNEFPDYYTRLAMMEAEAEAGTAPRRVTEAAPEISSPQARPARGAGTRAGPARGRASGRPDVADDARTVWVVLALPFLDGYLRTALNDLIRSPPPRLPSMLLQTRALHRCFPVAWLSQNRPGAGNASGWRTDGALERASVRDHCLAAAGLMFSEPAHGCGLPCSSPSCCWWTRA